MKIDISELKSELRDKTVEELIGKKSETYKVFLETGVGGYLRLSNLIDFEIGVRRGWWEDWNEKEPIPHPRKFTLSILQESGMKFFSQLLVKLKIYETTSEAKSSGWHKPLSIGDFLVKHNGFQKTRILIE